MSSLTLPWQPARPEFRLIYKGVNISDEVKPHLISCTYTDKVHGESDEIEFTVQDHKGLWRGPWCPEHGDSVDLSIGYKGSPLVNCGTFELDEPSPSMGRSGDTMAIKGVATAVTKALRTKKTKGFDNQSLKQVVDKIAAEQGLTVIGPVPDIQFERVTQRRERDLQFLTRLAENFGAYFTVKGSKLVFIERDKVHEREEIMTISEAAGLVDGIIAPSTVWISADLKRGAHKTYSKAKATYWDGNRKKKIEVEVEDKGVRTGDTLRIDDRVENESQARARAKAELQKANQKQFSGSMELVGNPYVVAGQTISLDAGFGKWAQKYVIKQSRHALTRQAYTTNIEFEGVSSGGSSSSGSGKSTSATSSENRMGFASPGQRA